MNKENIILVMLVARDKAEDYSAIERLLIVTEGMKSDNVRNFVKGYNISHDTFYTWKKDLISQINIVWGDNKTEFKKLETLGEKEEQINAFQEELKKSNKETEALLRKLEQAHLQNFRLNILWSTVSEQLKDKIPLKYHKSAVIQEVENLQYINLEEACEALKIAVGTLRSWKREYDKKKVSN